MASGGGGDATAAAAAPPVEVIGREEIGGYDVTRARVGSDRQALDTWLDEHGYKVPDGAEPTSPRT